jgi:hypothetical protein
VNITPELREQAATWHETRDLQPAIIGQSQRCDWLVSHCRRAAVQRRNGSVRHLTPISGNVGYVDLTLAHLHTGAVIAAELKTQRGSLEPAQRRWSIPLRRNPGVLYVLWRPLDLIAGDVGRLLTDPARVLQLAAEQSREEP